jgi:hypothetical protein
MPTNLAIDDRLIAQAQKLGRHRTKKMCSAESNSRFSLSLEPSITMGAMTTSERAGNGRERSS